MFILLAFVSLGSVLSGQTAFAISETIESTYSGSLIDSTNNGICDTPSSVGESTSSTIDVGMLPTSGTDDCLKAEIQFDVHKIGGSEGITISDVIGSVYVYYTIGIDEKVNWVQLDNWDVIFRTDQQRWDSIGNGTHYISDVEYATTSTWYNSTLGALAISDLESLINAKYFDVSVGSSTGNSFDVTSQATVPRDIIFNPDGSKAFILDDANNNIYQYTMTPVWNVTGMSYDGVSASVSEESVVRGMTFGSQGTKAYTVGSSANKVFQYELATPYDLSSMTYSSKSYDPPETTTMFDIEFNSDGTKMYILEPFGTDEIQQYSLSTAWEIDTATSDSVSFNVGTLDTSPRSIDFNDDGTIIMYLGHSGLSVFNIELSTAYDLSTAAYNGVFKNISSSGANPSDAHFRDDGGYFYIVEDNLGIIDEYSMPQVFTLGLESSPATQDADIDVIGFTGVSSGTPPVIYLEYTNNLPALLPGQPLLGAHVMSETTTRYQSAPGTEGDNPVIWYSLRCELNGSGGWNTIVSNSSLPASRNYEYTGLVITDDNICQWRDGSIDGWSVWSANASDKLPLMVLSAQRTIADNPDDRLLAFVNFIDGQGGVYFGLGVLPFGIMLIGFMAGKKTVRIFTLATLFLMGMIHASGYYIYPDWYWTICLLFGIILIMGRMKSD